MKKTIYSSHQLMPVGQQLNAGLYRVGLLWLLGLLAMLSSCNEEYNLRPSGRPIDLLPVSRLITLKTTDSQGNLVGNVVLIYEWLDCEYDFTYRQQTILTDANGIARIPYKMPTPANPLGSLQIYAKGYLQESYGCFKPRPGQTITLIASHFPSWVDTSNK